MNKLLISLFVLLLTSAAFGQSGSMALSPARFELEMMPGTETTVVLNLDYKAEDAVAKPVRIVATLNDWTISKEGLVEYFPANTRPNSASPWLIYTPGEAAVSPNVPHAIRVTVSVPANAAAGDHLAALIIEQRADTLKFAQNSKQIVVRYRLASVFYIKVGKLTRKGEFGDLIAEAKDGGVTVTPKLRNEGNSVIRPTASISVFDAEGRAVADVPESEILPILANTETAKPTKIEKELVAGKYTVKYRIDFKDGRPPTEGVTDLVINPAPQIANSGNQPKKP